MDNQFLFEPWPKYEQDLEIFLKRFFEGQLKDLCYNKVMDLDVSFSYSEEPIPFKELDSLKFQQIKVGEIWARENFACAWFHLTGKLSEGTDVSELYLEFNNDGEGLLVDRNGSSLKGFTSGSPVFGVMDYTIEKRYYPLAEIVDEKGNVEAYIDGASNSLLGEYVYDSSRLKASAVVRANPQMQSIYRDFDVLLDYVRSIPEENPHKFKILYGLRSIRNLIVYNDPDLYDKEKAIVKELFTLEGNENLQITAVGHAHLDLGWLWPIRESKRKAKRTFANAIYLMKRYPDFHFVVSQPQQLAWIKELDPKLYEEIRKFAKEGRIELVGGGWVENDTNLPCEESLVRQELYGQKFWLEEFGSYVNLRWLPDAFGYTATLPQILKLSHQDNFMTIKLSWSNRTLFPYNTFRWAGIDGSEVTVHMPPEGTYNSLAGPKALLDAKRGIKKADPTDTAMLVYGIGDGGGGPSAVMVERCRREKNIPYLPKVTMGTAQGYFDKLDKQKLSLYSGEMYLEKHRGTYTSQSNSKKYNRDFEEKMLSLEVLLSCLGEKGNQEEIDKLWKEALLYQFHDILPGSCIRRVYEETDIAYEEILSKLEQMVNDLGCSFVPDKQKSLINPDGRNISKLENFEGNYLWYQGNERLITPVVYSKAMTGSNLPAFETDYYTVAFAADGSFESIRLRGSHELISEKANQLRVFVDIGDAWDFEDDYRDQLEQYMQLIHTEVKDFGDLVEVKQFYEFKNSKLVQTIVMHKQDPCIYITHEVDWKDSGYMLRAEFSPVVWSDTVYSDIQFGYLGRPTTDNTVHEMAQFEMCCQKWFDISEENKGFAILNNVKSGFMAKQKIISLNLLRSTDYPCINAEQKHICYRYALYPHVGGFNPVQIDRQAQQYNARYLYGNQQLNIPSFDTEQIQMTAFKPAYDGNGYILRAFERAGHEVVTHLNIPQGYVLKEEVDLLEETLAQVGEEIPFNPFQIRSFRLVKG